MGEFQQSYILKGLSKGASYKVKIKSRNEFGFSPDTEMGLMRTFDAYYQDQPKIIEKEKKSSESLYKTFGNNKVLSSYTANSSGIRNLYSSYMYHFIIQIVTYFFIKMN